MIIFFIIADVVLAMVLIEDMLTLLMMIEKYWYSKLSNQNTAGVALARETQNLSSKISVARIERRSTIAIAKWTMIAGQ